MTPRLADLVVLPQGFMPAVTLPDHFVNPAINADLLAKFIPTPQSMDLLAKVVSSMGRSNPDRARQLHGTYGTGKSDLLLMLANIYQRNVDDPVLEPLFQRMQNSYPQQTASIRMQRQQHKPFLVVLMQAQYGHPFAGHVLHVLDQALQAVDLGHLLTQTKYAAAHEQIDTWETQHPDIFQRFHTVLMQQFNLDSTTLRSNLQSDKADIAFDAFVRAHVVATGVPFTVYTYHQPHEAIMQVARELVATGRYSGLVLLIDEFYDLLRRFARSSEAQDEAMVLQNLAAFAASSDNNQFHLLVASLEPFASASAQMEQADVKLIIERVGGRFKDYGLQLQESEVLLKGALASAPGTEQVVRLPQRQRDQLVTIGMQLWRPREKTLEWIRETIIDGTWPLHPLTTYLLPTINQRVAQSQRTMFMFLSDPAGLPRLLAETPLTSTYPDWHALITPDVLFDYFQDSIKARYDDIYQAFAQAQLHVQAFAADLSSEMRDLSSRILKILALCEITSAVSPTLTLLHQALNLPDEARSELQQALDLLDQADALYVPSEIHGAYGLMYQNRVSMSKIRRLLDEKARAMGGRATAEALHTAYPARDVEATTYNQDRGTERKLLARFISLAQLRSERVLQEQLAGAEPGNGVLLYVLTENEPDRQTARTLAMDLTGRQPYARLVVAVPRQPTDVLDRLRAVQVLDALRNDSSVGDAERAQITPQSRIATERMQQLQHEVQRLSQPDSWEWFAFGMPTTQMRGIGPTVAARVFDRVYPDTPSHQQRQHLGASARAERPPVAISRTLELMLEGSLRQPRNRNSPEKNVIQRGALPMGLVREVTPEGDYQIYEATKPDARDMAALKVWKRFLALEQDSSWSKLLDVLRQPPFGLYDAHLMLFTAAFFAMHADELTIMRGRERLSISAQTIASIIHQPRTVTVTLQPLLPAEQQWLQGIITHGLGRPLTGTGPLRDRVAAQLLQWRSSLKLPKFAHTLTLEEVRSFLQDASPTLSEAAWHLLQIEQQGALADALLSTLPETLELPTAHAAWDTPVLERALADMHEVVRLLTLLPAQLEAHAAQVVAEPFEVQADDFTQLWGLIRQWRAMRSVVSATSLSGDARTLFRVTNEQDGSMMRSLLQSFAGEIVPAIGAYENWPSLTKLSTLRDRIAQAITVIDAQWHQYADQEQLWLMHVAREASGRMLPHPTTERVGNLLYRWAQTITWPALAQQLDQQDLQRLYPERDAVAYDALSQILRRRDYTEAQWSQEVSPLLASAFGVIDWDRTTVQTAQRRLTQAMTDAAALDAQVRQFLVRTLAPAFGGDDAAPLETCTQAWRDAHRIPDDNDLSETAQNVWRQLASSTYLETTLTEQIPRALPEIGVPYRQWTTMRQATTYLDRVGQALDEIAWYQPLADEEASWLNVLGHLLPQPAAQPAFERTRRAAQIAAQLAHWRQNVALPPWVTTLTLHDMAVLLPEASAMQLYALQIVLQRALDAPTEVLLEALPQALDLPLTEGNGSDAERVTRLQAVLALGMQLDQLLQGQFAQESAQALGLNLAAPTLDALMQALRDWRRGIVLLSDQTLSAPARALANRVRGTENAQDLLLWQLPRELHPHKQPYARWSSWDERQQMIGALVAAAHEITQAGHVGEASPDAYALWERVMQGMQTLSESDQRWLMKQFAEAFRQ